MHRDDLVSWLDTLLATSTFHDDSRNGLQIEGREEVTRVAVATDACLATLETAIAGGTDLLIVHHGLFWGACEPIVGVHGRRIRTALRAGLNLYASHLPLDAHLEVGNNAELARILELDEVRPWGRYHGQDIAVAGGWTRPRPLADLARTLEQALGSGVRTLPFGPDPVRRVALVSGGGADLLAQAAAEGFELLVTGEASHQHFHAARDAGVSLVLAGHYATETLGVRALGRRIEADLGLAVSFLDHPTGL
jgi:dinuclear metal center YbgI/SA1388 family protein